MERVCFVLQVRPERLEEYRARHAEVWPEMLSALSRHGWTNYSLFLRDDGMLIGYYETDDDAASEAALAANPATAPWEAAMEGFFISLAGRADQGASRIPEIFNLESQLSASTEQELS